jgi:hypothetical protein
MADYSATPWVLPMAVQSVADLAAYLVERKAVYLAVYSADLWVVSKAVSMAERSAGQ